jgi:Mg2+ and Co2+ transporter CorA
MDLKDKIAALANVLEEQYFTLSFTPRRDWNDESQPYRGAFRELLKTLEILKISLVQISQRLESIHSHYMLLIQETSNRRINILTIVQAVFVPLTLFAGVYGMNFSNIPELEWEYSYFVFLAVMVVLVVVELRYFYKKGWFD